MSRTATKPIFVTIQGPVSAMKSPTAGVIADAIREKRPDLDCRGCDHSLFTFYQDFPTELERVRDEAAQCGCDVFIIVIGTGNNDGPMSVTVEPGLTGSHMLFNVVMDYLTSKRATDGSTDEIPSRTKA